jgi:hypothetical protein
VKNKELEQLEELEVKRKSRRKKGDKPKMKVSGSSVKNLQRLINK